MKMLKRFESKKAIQCPPWLIDNLLYMNVHGSELYGCATDTSDKDCYGVCMPPKRILFPHTDGWINGFGNPPNFEQWQQHHIKDPDNPKKEYDFQVFNITKFMWLAQQGNPNIIECLFSPQDAVIHHARSFQKVRDIAPEFLTLKCLPRYQCYAVSQIKKLRAKSDSPEVKAIRDFEKDNDIPRSTTQEDVKKEQDIRYNGIQAQTKLSHLSDDDLALYGRIFESGASKGKRFQSRKEQYDYKFAYHAVRLLGYAEQILSDRYIDLRRDREIYKAIRRGDWSLEDIEKWVSDKVLTLDKMKLNTSLPKNPNLALIRETLINVIEDHYGDISGVVARDDSFYKQKYDEARRLFSVE